MKSLRKICLYIALVGAGMSMAMGLWVNALLCMLYPVIAWKDTDIRI